jgi:hypothetical protein
MGTMTFLPAVLSPVSVSSKDNRSYSVRVVWVRVRVMVRVRVTLRVELGLGLGLGLRLVSGVVANEIDVGLSVFV